MGFNIVESQSHSFMDKRFGRRPEAQELIETIEIPALVLPDEFFNGLTTQRDFFAKIDVAYEDMRQDWQTGLTAVAAGSLSTNPLDRKMSRKKAEKLLVGGAIVASGAVALTPQEAEAKEGTRVEHNKVHAGKHKGTNDKDRSFVATSANQMSKLEALLFEGQAPQSIRDINLGSQTPIFTLGGERARLGTRFEPAKAERRRRETKVTINRNVSKGSSATSNVDADVVNRPFLVSVLERPHQEGDKYRLRIETHTVSPAIKK